MPDRTLPLHTLTYFPVQFFSRREAGRSAHLRKDRSPPGEHIHFIDSFGGSRRALADTMPHRAIDIMAPRKVPVFAALSGVVPVTWFAYEETSPGVRRRVEVPGVGTTTNPMDGDGGNYVVLIDDAGRHHYYAHLHQAATCTIGQRVHAGQQIGFVGNTGRIARRTSPHLHYQVTTRPGIAGHSVLTFWNPYPDLVRLATALGAVRRGIHTELSFDAFDAMAQDRRPTGLADPWTGPLTSEITDPWLDAY